MIGLPGEPGEVTAGFKGGLWDAFQHNLHESGFPVGPADVNITRGKYGVPVSCIKNFTCSFKVSMCIPPDLVMAPLWSLDMLWENLQ